MGTPKQRNTYLKYRYGISLEEFDQISDLQLGVCAICKKPQKFGKPLHVDHKHTKGERKLKGDKYKTLIRSNVRGLLCWSCNRAIAMFRDNSTVLRSAADYLDNWPSKKVLT